MMTEIKVIHCTNEDNFFTKAWIKNHCMALSGRPFARLVEKNQECCFYFLLRGTVTKNNKKQKAKYVWLTRCNAEEICNANRDT